MRFTVKEWLDMQRNTVRVCAGPENMVPKVIFVGTMTEDGTIEARMKLVTAIEWENFETVWRRISGANCLDKGKSLRQTPQFFLI
ncbi:MAG: hypothetical protein KH230_16410 [Enterocloster asparagiformis]|nr:hypothetical protein [Enterocloster asparagiformis]